MSHEKPKQTLTAQERFMLRWLSTDDFSQYGECHGKVLDHLIELGLAQVHGEDSEHSNNFIAKGDGIMFRAVSLTEQGRILQEQFACSGSDSQSG
jgi:hypothetical protein